MHKNIFALALSLVLAGCVGLYRPIEPARQGDDLLSCDQLHSEFSHFQKKETNIAADASSITGNRYTEILLLPVYVLAPWVLLSRLGGGPTHKVSKAEHSYICRQAEVMTLLKEKSCKLSPNEESKKKMYRCPEYQSELSSQ